MCLEGEKKVSFFFPSCHLQKCICLWLLHFVLSLPGKAILLRSRDVVEEGLLGGWLEVDAESFASSLHEIPGDKCNA